MESKIYDYYVLVYNPSHSRAVGDGYVPEQILVAEESIGRPLSPDEDVRHINADPQDNRPENLEIVSANSGYRVQSLVNTESYFSTTKRTISKTFIPCKFQQPCWHDIRAPAARRLRTYLPYVCSYQSEGDIYTCARYWSYLEANREEKRSNDNSNGESTN